MKNKWVKVIAVVGFLLGSLGIVLFLKNISNIKAEEQDITINEQIEDSGDEEEPSESIEETDDETEQFTEEEKMFFSELRKRNSVYGQSYAVGGTLRPSGNRVTSGGLGDYNTWIPSDYNLSIKFTPDTKVEGWGGVVATEAPNQKVMQVPKNKQGALGLWYRNIGMYNGERIDIKVTLDSYTLNLGTGSQPFGVLRFFEKEMTQDIFGIYDISETFSFYKSGTSTPINVKGALTFGDIDYAEELVFPNFDTSNWHKAYVHHQNQLGYGMTGNELRFVGGGKDAQKENTPQAFATGIFQGTSVSIKYEDKHRNVVTKWPTGNGGQGYTFILMTTNARPFKTPVIKKQVSDSNETKTTTNTLNSKEESFTYTFETRIPNERKEWWYNSFQITDKLPNGIETNGSVVVRDSVRNENLTSQFTSSIDVNNNLTVKAINTKQANFYDRVLEVTVPVKLNSKIDLNSYPVIDGFAQITNKATIITQTFDNSQRNEVSNTVTTKVPLDSPKPTIQKKVRNITTGETVYQKSAKAKYDDVVEYEIVLKNESTNVNMSSLKDAAFTDKLPAGVTLKSWSINNEAKPNSAWVGNNLTNYNYAPGKNHERNKTYIIKIQAIVGQANDGTVRRNEGSVNGSNLKGTVPMSTADIVVLKPELKITKTVNKASVVNGEEFVYTIAMENVTRDDTLYSSMIIDDKLPAGIVAKAGTTTYSLNGGTSNKVADTLVWNTSRTVLNTKGLPDSTSKSPIISQKKGKLVVSFTAVADASTVGKPSLVNTAIGSGKYDLNKVNLVEKGKLYDSLKATATLSVKQATGSLQIIKQDDTKKRLAGAKYIVKNASGTQVGSGQTNATGLYTVANLPTGKYTVSETAAPTGHVATPVEGNNRTIEVVRNQTATLTFTNNRQGRIKIKKLDKESKAVLSGAEYRVSDSQGKPVIASIKTGADGTVTTGYLPAGKYRVQESAAPTNYELATPSSVEVTVKMGETTPEVVFENQRQKGSLQIIKQDDTKKRLAGAKYIVKNASGTQVGSGQTNATGLYTVANLPTGKYTVSETAAPTGHVATPVEGNNRTIEVVRNQTATLTFTNNRQGRIKIKKLDKESKAVLSGAEYRISDSQGKPVIASIKTGADGTVTTGYLPAGKYRVQESAAPTNYELATPSSVEVTVKMGETTPEVVFENQRQKGSLQIIKQDDTKKRLAGAKYIVKNASGTQVGSGKTNATGLYTVANLPTGKYTVLETAAPTGHVATPVEGNNRTIEVVRNQTATLTFTNNRQGRIKIKKLDKESKAVLSGAEYRVSDSQGKPVIASIKTGADGTVTTGYLPAGKYRVQESAAPTNYELATPSSVEVTVKMGETTPEVVFENQRQKGRLQIIKQDDTKKRLAGAEYIVKNASGTQVGRGETNAVGVYTVWNLPTGKYTVSETTAPTGHVATPVEGNNRSIDIVKDQTATLTFTNNRQGRIKIKKLDKESKAVLSGAEYRVSDSQGKPVIASIKTGADGTVITGYLPAGKYRVQESAAPTNYELATPSSVEVTVKMGETTPEVVFENQRQKGSLQIIKQDDTKKRLAGAKYIVKNASGTQVGSGQTNANGLYTVANLPTGKYTVMETAAPTGHVATPVEGNNRTIEVVRNQTATLTFTNNRQGRIKIKKLDKESKAVLSGAEYRVSDSQGKPVIASIKTGADGTVTTGYLPAGKYRVQESAAPTNYELATPSSVEVTVKMGETTPEVVFENQRQKGSLQIIKQDDTKKRLANAQYIVKNASGIQVGSGKTNANGLYTVANLPTGKYTVMETAAPAGHVGTPVEGNNRSIDIVKNQTATLTFTNNRQGKISIHKIDKESKAALAGAEYSIFDSTGKEVQKKLQTNSNGWVTSAFLTAGEYKIIETAAPTNYELASPSSKTINLKMSDNPQIVEFENVRQKGGLQIIKVDEENKERKLKGAVFDIASDEKGINILYRNQKTDSEGKISIPTIATGTYYIRETAPPAGYQIIKKGWIPLTVVQGKTTIYQVENRPIRLHLRQVVLNQNEALVIPSSGYFKLDQFKNSGNTINTYQLVTGSTIKNKPTEITKELFTTVNIPVGVDKLQIIDLIPEYYTYQGAIATIDDINLGEKHSFDNSSEIEKNNPITVDYSKSSEYWVTVFIEPKMGTTSSEEKEKEPRPYSWDYKTNELGRLTQVK
ncbi:SpaA isopeptide-forming pilin-related protein [Enterococcus crotali]|uniref:SpaA isopeptide-forming pilin-related protein n=1 Tax=Enterococcus crotali TaxID=1453587 RepID=UPI0004713984|nr:SpaA isopeptide-forming pilin-related protein [Enterococcus crotali]